MRKPLLPFLHAYSDRHGHRRYYFRRKGFRKVALPGAPGSIEFMDAYTDAQRGAQPAFVGTGQARGWQPWRCRTRLSCVRAFVSLAPYVEARASGHPGRARPRSRHLPIAGMKRQHVAVLLDRKAGLPGAALNLLSALRVLMRYAVDVGLRSDDPTDGCPRPKLRDGGFYPWTEDDIARFEQRHPIGTKARLALALSALHRAAPVRRDPVRPPACARRMHPPAAGEDRQGAGDPDPPRAARVIDATPGDNLTFLVSELGGPFSPDGFYSWFRRCCRGGRRYRSGHTPRAHARPPVAVSRKRDARPP